jgi:cysteine desulfurase/selenocysteine lyase
LPAKFEAGTPMIAQVMGLGQAVDYVSRLGFDAITAWEHQLLSYATDRLTAIGDTRRDRAPQGERIGVRDGGNSPP